MGRWLAELLFYALQRQSVKNLQVWTQELDGFWCPDTSDTSLKEPHESLAITLYGSDQDHHLSGGKFIKILESHNFGMTRLTYNNRPTCPPPHPHIHLRYFARVGVCNVWIKVGKNDSLVIEV